MKSKIFIIATILCSWLGKASAQSLLQGYIDIALKNNPYLRAYNLQSNSMKQKIEPAGALDDPMLYGGVANLPVNFSFTQDMMTMKEIGLRQNFSVGKKYVLRGAVAQKEYEASVYDVETQKLSLIKQVKQQYYDLYAQTKAIEITKRNIETLKSYIQIANTRNSAGLGTQQDIFKAEVELSNMQKQLIDLQSMREHMIATFNTLLARDMMDSVEIPSEIRFREINLQKDSLMLAADRYSPLLLSSKSMTGKDSASYMLAKTSKTPDFTADLWYGQRQAVMSDGIKAPDMLGVSFGITLPVFAGKKQDPLIASSMIQMEKSKSEVESTQNEVELMLHHGLIAAEKNEKLVSLYSKQLIPQATENLDAGINGYQENKIDFMTLIDNFLSLYNDQLQYYQAVADYYKALAEIEMLTVKNLIPQN